jgi:hypothetical protein
MLLYILLVILYLYLVMFMTTIVSEQTPSVCGAKCYINVKSHTPNRTRHFTLIRLCGMS